MDEQEYFYYELAIDVIEDDVDADMDFWFEVEQLIDFA